MNAFKAYDIRGIYNVDFNKEDVYKIGFFLPGLLKADRVLIGQDGRVSSNEIYNSLTEGITDSGADVYYIGYSTTPMVYFATAKHGFPASVQITASHNPKEYNGLKVSTRGAIPVGYESGLQDLENLIKNNKVERTAAKGKVHKLDVKEEYIEFLKQYLPSLDNMKVGVDCSNGMASILIKDILGQSPIYIYDEMDCTFPNHEPNPLEEVNTQSLKELVLKNNCDLGIIYDGDADRVVFVDEKGRFVSPDLVIGVIGLYYLEKEKGNVLHDIRTTKAVSEYIEKLGGTPNMWKVGHAYAKVKLKEIKGIFGGELAGHYYFRDFYNCDSGILASLLVLNVVSKLKKENKTFSQIIDEIKTYANSGELNFRIENKTAAMEKLKEVFTLRESPQGVYDFDGYRIEFKDWWFNVRPSNTEPYLRLVVEAGNQEILDEKLTQIKAVLKEFE
ncbi:phosphomannomutase/phosphoglucomutase [Oxobacter pfennigii]|uniref:Phosphomannomutase/phosphoglucomutase n=1 Tax=Oxobacter pfennigii TaxID=36849 RepID=A0A0P8YF19_9CLOT|nr:phosphomannomutase/phosphoglucomutase [Oxobacter pfennigii]KPU45748.1 phosphomannomutase/phosphoglucomutase [Oxobacter pfennigii]